MPTPEQARAELARRELERREQLKPPSSFQRFGKYLPVAGAVTGGILGSELGPGAIGTAALGAGAGEAGRQLLGRMIGEKSPQTSTEAAKQIGIQGALGAASEAGGQVLGKLGGMAFKGLPKVGQMLAGTPARNLVKAEERGLMGTYFPKIARGISREEAGSAQGKIENEVFSKYFSLKERASIVMNRRGAADEAVTNALMKMERNIPLDAKEAIATVKGVDTLMPAETAKNAPRAAAMAKARKYANDFIAKTEPEYSQSKKVTEATILRSQLSKPFRVNRTNPDQYSGFMGALAPMLGGIAYGTAGPKSALEVAGGILGTSPLAFGVTAGTLGSIKNATNPIIRRAIQRAILQMVGQRENPLQGQQSQ